MSLSNLDVSIGQLYRKYTHIKRFYNALNDPARAQRDKLKQIIESNAASRFGKEHNFSAVQSYADYQSLVPASSYEYFRPYVERLKKGEGNQLTCEEPFMFATTSGTTAQPKFVPITSAHLKDYTHAFQVHNYHLIESFTEAAYGKFLIIVSNDEEGRVASG